MANKRKKSGDGSGVITVKGGPAFHAVAKSLSERHKDMPLQTLLMLGVRALIELSPEEIDQLWFRFQKWRATGFSESDAAAVAEGAADEATADLQHPATSPEPKLANAGRRK